MAHLLLAPFAGLSLNSTSLYPYPLPPPPPPSPPASAPLATHARYRCHICFTPLTLAQLPQHSQAFHGGKHHRCPHPTCDKRCNRYDELLHHYQCHLPKHERYRARTHLRVALACAEGHRAASALPHGCPYPECTKRSARTDYLLEHYRMHLPTADQKRSRAHVRKAMAAMRESLAPADSGDKPPPRPSGGMAT